MCQDTTQLDKMESASSPNGSVEEEDAALEDVPKPLLAEELTRRQVINLVGSVLAWACTISNVTLVVGTSNVVMLNIGGSQAISSVPLATFVLGSSFVSLLVTPWHFQKLGRKVGLLVGVGFGLTGTALGVLSVFYRLPPLLIVATLAFGAATGIGFYLRFAAVEVVPKHFADKAVTLVVSGGCIAAFAGPESAQGTIGLFGDQYQYMGVFMMAGIFNIANAIFTCIVDFPPPETIDSGDKDERWSRVRCILGSRNFIMPVLIAGLSWSIMAMPMSLLRVAMKALGFTSRQSLLAIEIHFLCMYAPGFVTGRWIARYGARSVSAVAFLLFVLSIVLMQVSTAESGPASLVTWILGMAAVGAGWNFGFTASTVGSTRSYQRQPDLKSTLQAFHEGLSFLMAGAFIYSSSYIYQAGGGALAGWQVLNWVAAGLLGVLLVLLLLDRWLEGDYSEQSADSWSAPSSALK